MAEQEIVAADIGGTHARFAIATIGDGKVQAMSEPVTLKTAEHASLQRAWESFGETIGRELPRAAGIAIATPIVGDVLKMTNNPWIIRPALIPSKLNVDQHVLVNDFGAVGYAVATLGPDNFDHLCGPDHDFPENGPLSIVGPGTGLGVAQVVRADGHYHVVETEGGHMEFAALDRLEDAVLDKLRSQFTRVSVERVVSGPGLVAIYETLARIEGKAVVSYTDKELWTRALEETDSLAVAAFDRFCLSLGSVAGDVALVQGAKGVVIAGGLGHRIKDRLKQSGFATRFAAKGRFQTMMESIPVRLLTHPQPGLYGAAAAFVKAYE